jgi:spore coat assembly protein
MSFQVGDIVGRISYDSDVYFRIIAIDRKRGTAELKGIDMRLYADSPLEDLIILGDDDDPRGRGQVAEKKGKDTSEIIEELKNKRELGDSSFQLPGRVLHIDGDSNYLKKCLEAYKELDIPVRGIHIAEKELPQRVFSLLKKIKPDILVMTGHDAFIKSKGDKGDINAYRNSIHFRDAVQRARDFEKNRDNLIIFAGACQSHFESLIQAGANFASSPERINIHALDPVYIVEKASYTSIKSIIGIKEIFEQSLSGSAGLGGIDTKGTLRTGEPHISIE